MVVSNFMWIQQSENAIFLYCPHSENNENTHLSEKGTGKSSGVKWEALC